MRSGRRQAVPGVTGFGDRGYATGEFLVHCPLLPAEPAGGGVFWRVSNRVRPSGTESELMEQNERFCAFLQFCV